MAQAPQPQPYQVVVVGAKRTPLRDAYHSFLRMPWSYALGALVAGYVGINALFALAYVAGDGIEGARPGSFADAYYFSIQTMGTIGYGVMHPRGWYGNGLVAAESVTGLLVLALATGLVFSKFSRSTSRVAFTRRATIAPVDGVPTLMIRIGNERGNRIVEAAFHVVLTRTEKTREGVTLYRSYDLTLTRERAPALTRSWTIMHAIGLGSPLAGRTPADLIAEEAEIGITIVGLDDTTGQTVHALYRYLDTDIVWGARHADVLYDTPDGNMVLDLRRFDDVEATEPTEEFPYPKEPPLR